MSEGAILVATWRPGRCLGPESSRVLVVGLKLSGSRRIVRVHRDNGVDGRRACEPIIKTESELRPATSDHREDPNAVSTLWDRLAGSPSAFCFLADTLTMRRTLTALHRLRSDIDWGPRVVTVTIMSQPKLRTVWLRGVGLGYLASGFRGHRAVPTQSGPNPRHSCLAYCSASSLASTNIGVLRRVSSVSAGGRLPSAAVSTRLTHARANPTCAI